VVSGHAARSGVLPIISMALSKDCRGMTGVAYRA
jgi:hypothetical protein